MARRVISNGNSRPHLVHTGYRYQSDQSARLERQPDAFDWAIIAYMITGTAAVVGFILWSAWA